MTHTGIWQRFAIAVLLVVLQLCQATADDGNKGGARSSRRAAPIAPAAVPSSAVPGVRCVLIEIYYRQGDSDWRAARSAVEQLRTNRGGISIVLRDVEAEARNQDRQQAILRHFRLASTTSPVVYGCNGIVHRAMAESDGSWSAAVEQLLRIEVFVRPGCSRCQSAKNWLSQWVRNYPGLKLAYRDIAADSRSAARLTELVARHQAAAASVPVFHLCNQLIVGFDRVETTGERVENLLTRWTHPCVTDESDQPSRDARPQGRQIPQRTSLRTGRLPISGLAMLPRIGATTLVMQIGNQVDLPQPSFDGGEGELPLPLPLPLPIPEDAENVDNLPLLDGSPVDDNISLPVFGRLSASRLGMPLFTLAVGLVDGFNPCAMWVLLFLLSILVNLKDRRRILAIAGTFVVVSGLAYFVFMAAWMNVFMLIGYLRPIQVGLATMAILIGGIHIKDFFAFRQGLSLSIPESVKPGIYARVRRIVTAEHLGAALVGAITLAVLVNVVELLCTAGLPALYTNILMQQGYSPGVRYAYLGLYILAYMFDDTLMVGIVVLTLSKRKLQEGQGRWLKLISGATILLLGVVMLFRPEWLY